jgi:hypothetical protein
MFFILLYGWDGLGYDRFLYDRDMIEGSPAWVPGAGTADGIFSSIFSFMGSSVAFTLFLDGIYLIPPLTLLMYLWLKEVTDRDTTVIKLGIRHNNMKVLTSYIHGVYTIGFGTAAFCAIVIALIGTILGVDDHVLRASGEAPQSTFTHVLSYFIGFPLALYITWRTLLKPGKIYHKLLNPLWMTPDGTPSTYQAKDDGDSYANQLEQPTGA